jgi:hypothetical protein
MSDFFRVSDNSLQSDGYPWIERIHAGMREPVRCKRCGVEVSQPGGDLEVSLDENQGTRWPDVLGCGAHPLLIVSASVVESWQNEEQLAPAVGGRVSFRALPKGLEALKRPSYFWIDGARMRGANLDFQAGGFVDVRFCAECETRSENITATHTRQASGHWPYVFAAGTWNGAKLFTSDLSPAVFFCTDEIVECARRHRHRNFRFIPSEAGGATWSAGIDYLAKTWPTRHPLRPSDGRTVAEWVEELRQPELRYPARRALLDLGAEAASAVAALTGMLQEDDEELKREAALLFSALVKLGVTVGPEGEEAARQHEAWLQSTLGRPR